MMADMLKDSALHWYMRLLRFLVTSYQDLCRRMIHHFSANKYIKMSTTSLFNVLQGHSESLQEYLARFKKETIKFAYPNQNMFVWAFQNDLKVQHSNESLAQKLTSTIEEIMARAECYIKCEESNT